MINLDFYKTRDRTKQFWGDKQQTNEQNHPIQERKSQQVKTKTQQ